MGKKGQKGQKDVPEMYDEVKKRVNLALTPTGIEGLDAIASNLDLSRSELVERIGRRLICLDTNSFTEEEMEAVKKH
ncbi:hypothetical protein [Nostoc sp.]|uniref:hypothetical protein n=1 Tax=Nostoc sp. TaxID=1180 RepID=UPI002FF6BD8B